jgi:hypothetical protein
MQRNTTRPVGSLPFTPLFIAECYVVVSIIWILFSYQAVSIFISGPAQITAFQTIKGLGFLITPAALLFLLIQPMAKGLLRSNKKLWGSIKIESKQGVRYQITIPFKEECKS